jgi:hypothetical protein
MDHYTVCINPVTGTNTTAIQESVITSMDAIVTWSISSEGISTAGSLFVVITDLKHEEYKLLVYVI